MDRKDHNRKGQMLDCTQKVFKVNPPLHSSVNEHNRPLALRGHGHGFYENESYMILPSKHYKWVIS